MLLDPLKSAIQNVLDLVNDANQTAFTEADLSVGVPEEFVDPEGLNPRNTAVTLSATPENETHRGQRTVRYTRLDLAAMGDALVEPFQLTGDSTLEDLKAFVVDELGLIADEVDFLEDALPVFEDPVDTEETAELTLVANDGSLVYIGEAAITVREPVDGRTHLNEAIPNTDLDGFDADEAGEPAPEGE